MLCEIARKLDEEKLEAIRSLEHNTDLTIVAFACRSFEPQKEERLRQVMEQFGPLLLTEPAEPDCEQLDRLREAEADLGLALVAVRP